MQITLTVDRATRALLIDEAELSGAALTDFDHYLADRDRDMTVKLKDAAVFAVDLLDALGWDADDPREECEFTIDCEPFNTWLCDVSRDVEQDLGATMVSLAQQERGKEGSFWAGEDQAGSISRSRALIERATIKADRVKVLSEQLADCLEAVAA